MLTYDLAHLRRAAAIAPEWSIDISEEELPTTTCAELRWKLRPLAAQIVLNTRYHFSDAAYTRTVMHELLELAMLDMWILSYQALDNIPQPETREVFDVRIRAARDAYIEQRLRQMPFWSEVDVPVLKTDLEKTCSSPLRDQKVRAKPIRLPASQRASVRTATTSSPAASPGVPSRESSSAAR